MKCKIIFLLCIIIILKILIIKNKENYTNIKDLSIKEYSVKIGKNSFNKEREVMLYFNLTKEEAKKIISKYKFDEKVVKTFFNDVKKCKKIKELIIGNDKKIQKIYYQIEPDKIHGFKLQSNKDIERCTYFGSSVNLKEKLQEFMEDKDIDFLIKNFYIENDAYYHENKTYFEGGSFVKAIQITLNKKKILKYKSYEVEKFIDYFKLYKGDKLKDSIKNDGRRYLYGLGVNHDGTFTLYMR